MVPHFLRIALICSLLGPLGCVEFNTECTPPIAEPDLVVAHLADPVPVSRAVIRRRESALGNLITDAYLASFGPSWGGKRPVVALENAGGIRDLGLCLTRVELPRGPLTRRVLRDTLPFLNQLVVLELTEKELFAVLEHGVATLGTSSPAGQFLQVSGLSYRVDCDPGLEGRRVLSLRLPGEPVLERADASDTRTIPIALTDFLASGNDGFDTLKERTRKAREAGREPWQSTGRFTYNVVEAHLLGLKSTDQAPARLALDPSQPRIDVAANCE